MALLHRQLSGLSEGKKKALKVQKKESKTKYRFYNSTDEYLE